MLCLALHLCFVCIISSDLLDESIGYHLITAFNGLVDHNILTDIKGVVDSIWGLVGLKGLDDVIGRAIASLTLPEPAPWTVIRT